MTSGDLIGGLSHGDMDQGYADVDFGLLLTAKGNVLVYEGGQSCGVVGGYVLGIDSGCP